MKTKKMKNESKCPIVVGLKSLFYGEGWRGIIRHKMLYLMFLPALIFVTIFNYAPMFGIVIAFQEYIPLDGVIGSEFVGFKNFYSILFSPQSASYLEFRNTIYISLIRIATNFPIILIFTLLINEIKSKKAKTLVQGISYIPYFISWVCVGGMAYNLLKLDGGVFNQIIEMFGGTGFDWYAKPDYWWWILAASSLWKGMGWSTLIYISALGSIDTELYDACEIDGGGRYRKMVSVTLPGLMNMIMLQLILDIGAIMSDNYDQVMAMTNQSSALYEKTQLVSSLEFSALGGGSGHSVATAYGLLRGVLGMTLVLLANKVAKNSDNEGII